MLSTLFAPLVAAPLGAVSYLGVGVLLKSLNGFLSGFDAELSVSAISVIASSVTAGVLLWLTIHYSRDQRHLSLIVNGPGLGVIPQDPKPSLNAKCSLK